MLRYFYIKASYGIEAIMPQKKGDTKMRRMLVSVPEEIYKRLGHYSVETDRTMSEIVAEALKDYLEKREKSGKK
jgi:hypothetical protein